MLAGGWRVGGEEVVVGVGWVEGEEEVVVRPRWDIRENFYEYLGV